MTEATWSRAAGGDTLPVRQSVLLFAAFAAAYFVSALVRAITATLSPVLSAEFALTSGDLGLLAGGYFLGFAAFQLPLGRWLDRWGPRRVELLFLAVAVLGFAAFALATRFWGLLAARMLIGAGVCACLMAPLTGYRRWFAPAMQLRANSWMLMAGSFGMLSSTLPVQWLMPMVGWRGVFWLLALLVLLVMVCIRWLVPDWTQPAAAQDAAPAAPGSYAEVWRHPYFRRMLWVGAIVYGGMLAVQTLWAGPWLVKVAGYSAAQAAAGLFGLNACMLVAFWIWGLLMPRLAARGITVNHLVAWGTPLALGFLALNVVLGSGAGWVLWACYCLGCTFASFAQPAVAMAFAPAMAGRALSAYNLVIFVGVFIVQWAIGLLIDGLQRLGWSEADAFRGALGVFWLASAASYAAFLSSKADNRLR